MREYVRLVNDLSDALWWPNEDNRQFEARVRAGVSDDAFLRSFADKAYQRGLVTAAGLTAHQAGAIPQAPFVYWFESRDDARFLVVRRTEAGDREVPLLHPPFKRRTAAQTLDVPARDAAGMLASCAHEVVDSLRWCGRANVHVETSADVLMRGEPLRGVDGEALGEDDAHEFKVFDEYGEGRFQAKLGEEDTPLSFLLSGDAPGERQLILGVDDEGRVRGVRNMPPEDVLMSAAAGSIARIFPPVPPDLVSITVYKVDEQEEDENEFELSVIAVRVLCRPRCPLYIATGASAKHPLAWWWRVQHIRRIDGALRRLLRNVLFPRAEIVLSGGDAAPVLDGAVPPRGEDGLLVVRVRAVSQDASQNECDWLRRQMEAWGEQWHVVVVGDRIDVAAFVYQSVLPLIGARLRACVSALHFAEIADAGQPVGRFAANVLSTPGSLARIAPADTLDVATFLLCPNNGVRAPAVASYRLPVAVLRVLTGDQVMSALLSSTGAAVPIIILHKTRPRCGATSELVAFARTLPIPWVWLQRGVNVPNVLPDGGAVCLLADDDVPDADVDNAIRAVLQRNGRAVVVRVLIGEAVANGFAVSSLLSDDELDAVGCVWANLCASADDNDDGEGDDNGDGDGDDGDGDGRGDGDARMTVQARRVLQHVRLAKRTPVTSPARDVCFFAPVATNGLRPGDLALSVDDLDEARDGVAGAMLDRLLPPDMSDDERCELGAVALGHVLTTFFPRTPVLYRAHGGDRIKAVVSSPTGECAFVHVDWARSFLRRSFDLDISSDGRVGTIANVHVESLERLTHCLVRSRDDAFDLLFTGRGRNGMLFPPLFSLLTPANTAAIWAIWRRVRKFDANDSPVQVQLARSYYENGEYDKAEDLAWQAMSLASDVSRDVFDTMDDYTTVDTSTLHSYALCLPVTLIRRTLRIGRWMVDHQLDIADAAFRSRLDAAREAGVVVSVAEAAWLDNRPRQQAPAARIETINWYVIKPPPV